MAREDVDAGLMVARGAPAGRPPDAALGRPSAGANPEASPTVGAADDRDGEVETEGLAHERDPVAGPLGQQMLCPGRPQANALRRPSGALLGALEMPI